MDQAKVSTVNGGKIIVFKKEVQYVRQTHQGLTFVNTTREPSDSPQRNVSFPAHTKVTFSTSTDGRKHIRKQPKPKVKKTKAKKDVTAVVHSEHEQATIDFAHPGVLPPERQNYERARAAGRDLFSLPIWSTYDLPLYLPPTSRRLFHIMLREAPRLAYPLYEDGLLQYHPLRRPDRFRTITTNKTALLCSVAFGAMCDALRSGKRNSPDLMTFNSALYHWISQTLGRGPQIGPLIYEVMIVISILATIAGYLGHHEQWHMHMVGLMRAMKMVGGHQNIPTDIIISIRTADFSGAMSTMSAPYLPWIPRQQLIPSLHPDFDAPSQRRLLDPVLAPLGIHPDTVQTIAGVASFQRGLAYCRGLHGGIRFDPLEVSEVYDGMLHSLLTAPRPLASFRATDTAATTTTTPEEEEEEEEEEEKGGGVASATTAAAVFPTAIVPGAPLLLRHPVVEAIEVALRILSILYLRRSLPVDIPRGEDKMISTLEASIRTIIVSHQHSGASGSSSGGSGCSCCDCSAAAPTPSALRPALLWICIAGDYLSMSYGLYSSSVISSISSSHGSSCSSSSSSSCNSSPIAPYATANATSEREDWSFNSAPAPYASIYGSLLRCILTPQELAVPALVPEPDLVVCRVMDLKLVAKTAGWNERQALRRLAGI
ncbi:hypothetical protein BX600DRAFT_435234 [Xylariales sp. PMI_506]|nr:hypothetical protein BX600DRAFT_435234 [Xylariales sp. PMI_506]